MARRKPLERGRGGNPGVPTGGPADLSYLPSGLSTLMSPLARLRALPRLAESLEYKLPALIVALILLVILTFSVTAYDEVRRAAIQRANGQLATATSQLAETSARLLAERIARMRVALAAPTVAGRVAVAPQDTATLVRLVAAAGGLGDSVGRFELWTPGGVRRAVIGTPASSFDAAPRTAALRAAQRSGQGAVVSPLYADGRAAYYWIVYPVHLGPTPVGYLAERRRVLASARTTREIRRLVGHDVNIYLANPGGHEWIDLQGRASRPPGWGPIRTDGGRNATSDEHLIGSATVARTPWAIVATVSKAAALRPTRRLLERFLLLGVLLLGCGAVGAWWIGRSLTRPLALLTRAAEQTVGGDADQHVAIGGRDEIGRLAAAFNAMSLRVRDAHHAIAARAASLQEANDAKAAFLTMMSHELRTPLNAISGYTELMELGIRGPVAAEQLHDLVRIRRNASHLLTIINDILVFAQTEAKTLALHLRDVPIATLLPEVEAPIHALASAKGVHLQMPTRDVPCIVRADPERLRQVLINLLSNAVRHTDAGGVVALECACTDATIALAVRDTGEGIPPGKLQAIFEPFYQVDTSPTRAAGGTGLGLAISRELVHGMSGTIVAVSEVGVGSTFTVTLPRLDAAVAHGHTQEAEQRA